jgi:hypothetical protein
MNLVNNLRSAHPCESHTCLSAGTNKHGCVKDVKVPVYRHARAAAALRLQRSNNVSKSVSFPGNVELMFHSVSKASIDNITSICRHI